MKKFLVFLAGLLFIFLVLAGLSLLLPSKVSLTKSIGIEASSGEVFQKLEDFRSWSRWFPPMQDSLLLIDYSMVPRRVLIKDNTGKELMLEKLSQTKDTINIAVISKTSSKIAYQFIIISKDSTNTQLVLNVNTRFKWYPWEKVKGVFSDKIAGHVYQRALYQLKRLLEE